MDMHNHYRAEDWFARLHSPDCSAVERQRFAQWVAQPENQHAYADVQRLYDLSVRLQFDPAIRAATTRARDAASSEQRWHWRHMAPVAAAAAILLVIGLYGWLARTDPGVRYATGVGEQLTEILTDGSTIILDNNSAVTVHIDDVQRQVVLERGRVQFEVAHDAGRPFVAKAGRGTIRDLGTTFQLSFDQTGDNVMVTLLEGVVSVSLPSATNGEATTRTLEPGQEVTFGTHGGLRRLHQVDLVAARAWTRGELLFDDRPLGQLLDEMNRYTQAQIKLGDPSLGSIPISGVFHQGDQQSLLLALQAGWSLESRRSPQGDIILYRASAR